MVEVAYMYKSNLNFRHFLIGGPGGRRLSADCVGVVLCKIPNIIYLGTYPHTKEAVLKVRR